STWDGKFLAKKIPKKPSAVLSAQSTLTTETTKNYQNLPKELEEAQFFDVMLSWGHQKTVNRIKNFLDSHFRVWIDTREMKGDIFSAMQIAVSKSKIIAPCLSAAYDKDSDNCKRELEYAAVLKKGLTPIRMDKGPFSWSEFITVGQLYIDLDGLDPDVHTSKWNEQMESLCNQIRTKISGSSEKHKNTQLENDPLAI
ncbi:hypothetical protein HK096_009731, partial [Nowakowskiella sp. JEL0078]